MIQAMIQLENISQYYGADRVLNHINLEIFDGEFLTLLGPSGSGKTTLLRLLAGFETPTDGQIRLRGQPLDSVPPQKRPINTVFQNFALFPHLTVFDNVAFGLQCQGLKKSAIQTQVTRILKRVQLSAYQHRYPKQLSGGQQQRVAIARAVVNQPCVLLLDEPFSSLDYRLRQNLQLELKQWQRELGITFVFVTHDQQEALSLSDRIVVLADHRIQQIGTPREIYEAPTNLTVAKFIGELNIFTTHLQTQSDHTLQVTIESTSFELEANQAYPPKTPLHILVRPEDIRVYRERPSMTAIPGQIKAVIYKGSTVDLQIQLGSGQLLSATEFFNEDDENLFYDVGESIWWNWYPGWEVILKDPT